MMRDGLKNTEFWDHWIGHYNYEITHRKELLGQPFAKEDYRPQYTYELAQTHLWLALHHYSRGDPVAELALYFAPLLHYWEESERLGQAVWTFEQHHSRNTWSINLDRYIDCFWLVGLALALNIPDEQWRRLLALIGNEGEDTLLDRVIATRQPDRKIGATLCYPKPYARLLATIDAPADRQAHLLKEFVEHWYNDVGTAAKSGRQKQATSYQEPYWHGYHKLKGGYFGYWCIEAAAAVKAFNLDDTACLGLPHYPGDLLRPEGPSTHPRPTEQTQAAATESIAQPESVRDRLRRWMHPSKV